MEAVNRQNRVPIGCYRTLASVLVLGGCLGLGMFAADITPKVECGSMVNRKIPAGQIGLPSRGAVITEAVIHPEGETTQGRIQASLPEYCDITGAIAPVDTKAPNIEFRVSIPTKWNQKSWHVGGGGNNGVIPATSMARLASSPPSKPSLVAQGYAVYGSDSGHQSRRGPGRGRGMRAAAPDPSEHDWIVNQESWMNYAYQQLKKTHDVAMQVMTIMYGSPGECVLFRRWISGRT